MKTSTSSTGAHTLHFHKFLKPGALARIRDSIIAARSHRIRMRMRMNSLSQISLSPPPSMTSPSDGDGVNEVNGGDVSLCFSRTSFGPSCPQRKKLVASKYAYFVTDADTPTNDLTVDSQDLVVDSVNNDAVVVVAN